MGLLTGNEIDLRRSGDDALLRSASFVSSTGLGVEDGRVGAWYRLAKFGVKLDDLLVLGASNVGRVGVVARAGDIAELAS